MSSICRVVELTVVVVPFTVKLPPTTSAPEISTAPFISISVAVKSISLPAAIPKVPSLTEYIYSPPLSLNAVLPPPAINKSVPSNVKFPSPIIVSESDQVTSSLFAPDPSVSTKLPAHTFESISSVTNVDPL